MAEVADRPLIAQPNAGVPELVNGETVFTWSAEDAADAARRFVDLGVRMIGGCCGTTPEHVRAMAEVVKT